MPTPKQGCQKPEALTGKPSQCNPAQIKKCHGAEAAHPCSSERRTS